MERLIHHTAKGPLDYYRDKASFDWKLLKCRLEGQDCIKFQRELWDFIKVHPDFGRNTECVTLNDCRKRTVKRIRALLDNASSIVNSPWFSHLNYYDPAPFFKIEIMYKIVSKIIISLGTDRHHNYLQQMNRNEFVGCLALTEVTHGSNVKGIRTEARYDKSKKSFILNTPDFEAAKIWPVGLGKTATHAILFAQLITPDGVIHGIHAFVVKIRDFKTMLPLKGIIIGDIGEKIGLNGLDNGFVLFNNYAIPRECLLNKYGDVTSEGEYVTTIKNDNIRFGISLGGLSVGRITVNIMSAIFAGLAVTIAIRYNAARKQLESKNDMKITEYHLHDKLIPHLAAVYAIKIFAENFRKKFENFQKLSKDQSVQEFAAINMEIHALSCGAKALCSWTGRNIIQDCYESCGEYGYLKVSRLGLIRNDHDANCTGEGDGNVLVQQTSNWLLQEFSQILAGKTIGSPIDSAKFLNDIEKISSLKFNYDQTENILTLENLLECMKWIVCFYLKKTYKCVVDLKTKEKNNFVTKNDSQLFNARTLSLVYTEHALVNEFIKNNNHSIYDNNEKRVLNKLCFLYAASCIEKRLGDYYAGGFASFTCKMDFLIRESIIRLCKELTNDSIALVDVISPPDFVINSPLGMSDGNIYRHLEEAVYQSPQCFQRVSWWQEILKSNL